MWSTSNIFLVVVLLWIASSAFVTNVNARGDQRAGECAAKTAAVTPNHHYASELINGANGAVFLNVTDLDTSVTIMRPVQFGDLWKKPYTKPELRPAISLTSLPDGFDVHLSYYNNYSEPRSQGMIHLGGIPVSIMGDIVYSRDWRVGGSGLRPWNSTDEILIMGSPGALYPNDLFSPTVYLSNTDQTFFAGMSVRFPFYNHAYYVVIRLQRVNPSGDYGFFIDLNCEEPAFIALRGPPELVQPGQTWNVTFSMRFLNLTKVASNPKLAAQYGAKASSAPWLRTFEPYRRFFQCLYPRKTDLPRDYRPMVAWFIADSLFCNATTNPDGWYPDLRAHIYGFNATRDVVMYRKTLGWDRFTLWLASGVYCPPSEMPNFPFQMSTHWDDHPMYNSSRSAFRDIVRGGQVLGFWWGHTDLYMGKPWGYAEVTPFDFRNVTHINAAYAEMDGFIGVDATVVGLDTISGLDPSDQYDYISLLQARYPNVTFITEAWSTPDFVNSIVGGYHLLSYTAGYPNHMVDFIMPDTEFWLQLNAYLPGYNFSTYLDMAAELAAIGYTPLIDGGYMNGTLHRTRLIANATAYRGTVPADLQPISSAPIRITSLQVSNAKYASRSVDVTVMYEGGGELAMQYVWKRDGVILTDASPANFSGTTTQNLHIGYLVPGVYAVTISDECGCYEDSIQLSVDYAVFNQSITTGVTPPIITVNSGATASPHMLVVAVVTLLVLLFSSAVLQL